jgi:hypothetical protein
MATHDPSKWWARLLHRREPPPVQPDAVVATWKAAWVRGANAAWGPHRPVANPYHTEMERAAWQAGWKWAELNPDRRTNRVPRFAHPRRRAMDSSMTASLKRAAAVGATGVTLYAISKALRRWSRPRES